MRAWRGVTLRAERPLPNDTVKASIAKPNEISINSITPIRNTKLFHRSKLLQLRNLLCPTSLIGGLKDKRNIVETRV